MLLYKDYDRQVVVFNSHSGDTHLLDKIDADILKASRMEAPSMPQLEQMLINDGRCGDRTAAAEYLRMLMQQLTALGLTTTTLED